MSTLRSAEVIAFPLALRQPAGEADAPDRLRRALAGLDAALAAQRQAVADWRKSLAALHGTVQGLAGSLHAYQHALGNLAGGVTTLNAEALRLEAWAERTLAAKTERAGA